MPEKKRGRKSKAEVAKLKEQARLYFMHGNFSYKEIAAMINVQDSTVSGWAQDGKWKEDKQVFDNTPRRLMKELYGDIDNIRQKAIKETRTLDSKETDSITKLAASIAHLNNKLSPSIYMEALMNFNDYLKEIDLQQAKIFIRYQKEFISRMLNG